MKQPKFKIGDEAYAVYQGAVSPTVKTKFYVYNYRVTGVVKVGETFFYSDTNAFESIHEFSGAEWYEEEHCSPTLEEAQAECDRRNGEKDDN